ncbi:Small nuclear ribonucleoprotein G [Mycena chlorophos]|uniref:Small nuclear ribonucleoprotein G n=1 Tax=Mycena chlorophos TaxID=658473 RepID=A0A8H6WDA9_MYCCL|nr:Small nuclear ribonucleoprotein G [Mycena chlorophos]
MSKASQPELKKFMDKKLFVNLQGGRKVSGTLRGYDLFLNLVIDDAVEETTPAQKHQIGTVVIRGNSYILSQPCGSRLPIALVLRAKKLCSL